MVRNRFSGGTGARRRSRRVPSILLAGLAAVLAVASARAHEGGALPCSATVVEGRVEHGEAFAAPFAEGLVFRLDPATHPNNPQGWTLRVTPADDAEADYAHVVSPPYRFSNPRYVDTGYGLTAEAAIGWSPRGFRYVASGSDYATARAAVEVVLWPADHPETALAAARAALEGLQAYDGRLWIEDGSTKPFEADPAREVIAWMRFRVELCLPEGARGAEEDDVD